MGDPSDAPRFLAELRRRRGTLGPTMRSISHTSRQSRCVCRKAPWMPASVQITSRSGGESDSMNHRAVSAP